MVSRVPTPSLKYVKLEHNGKLAAYALAAALIPAMIIVPWATLILGLVIYLGIIPFGIHAAAEAAAEEHQ
jgi:phosphatidylserine synthase